MRLPPSEWIQRCIRINTITNNGNEEIIRFLIPLLEQTGLKVVEQAVNENGTTFKNLIAFSDAPDSQDLLALNSHLDTVSFGNASDWTKTKGDPFCATRVRDRIYGLGTADVKLDFLCKIVAARAANRKQPIAIVGTFGEERGLVGAEALFSKKKLKPRFAMVGEPSNLELVYAHKGHLVFTVVLPVSASTAKSTRKMWKGKSAHSATPELGINAIGRGLQDVFKRGVGLSYLEGGSDSNKVPDRCEVDIIPEKTESTQDIFALMSYIDELAKDLKRRRDNRFHPPTCTLSLNQASTVDGKFHLTFDIRSLPDVDLERLEQKIRNGVKPFHAKLVDVTINKALRGRKNSKLMVGASRVLKTLGIKAVKTTKASSTEAAVYSTHGAESLVFGPGLSIGNVHRPNEYNSIRQMEIATQFYQRLMETSLGSN